MDAVREHERELTAYALERLGEVAGPARSTARADADARGALVSFALDGVHPHDVAEILGRERRLRARRPPLRAAADEARSASRATTRASFAVHTTREDVDALIDGLGSVQEVFAWPWTTCTARRSSSTTSAPITGATMEDPDLEFEDTNPLCGDELKVMLRVDDDGTVEDVRFDGHGCAISPGGGVDGLRRGQGHAGRRAARARPRRSCSTCSASTSPRRA